MFRKASIAGALLAAAILPAAADAAVVVTVADTSSGFTLTLNGSLDLTGMVSTGTDFPFSGIRATGAYIGVAGDYMTTYSGMTGPATLGSGTRFVSPNDSSGTLLAIIGSSSGVSLALSAYGYVPGMALSATSIFTGRSIADVGLTAGSYVYSLPKDTITVNIGPQQAAAVPEPATWATLVVGFGLMGAAMRRRAPRVLAA